MLDAEIALLADHQFGAFTRDQAVDRGATRSMIHRRVTAGRWRTVQPGVFAIAGTPDGIQLQLMAACLAGGDGSAISHRSAVALWSRAAVPEPGEVTIRREMRRLTSRIRVHRSRDLVPDHVTTMDGLPITTPARTMVDLGQVAPWWEVNRVMEWFLARQLVTVASLRAAVVVHSRHGRRGVGVLRRVLDSRALAALPAESVLEAALADLCRRVGLPQPAFQHELEIGGRRRRVDFAYPEHRIAIEVDGYEFHSSPSQFAADRVRGNELALAGWHVLHFTWDQVIHRPNYVVGVIERALEKLGR